MMIILRKKTTVFCNLSDEANQKMQTLWTDMKSSEEQTPNKVIVPAFMSVCVIASLIILIRRYIKKKKDMFLINGDRWSSLRGSSGGHRPPFLTYIY